jgi:hypothetical protein
MSECYNDSLSKTILPLVPLGLVIGPPEWPGAARLDPQLRRRIIKQEVEA